MLIADLPVGPLVANCYVVAREGSAECVVIDPGQAAEAAVAQVLAEQQLTPAAVLLTHGHFDHVWSAAQLCATYGVAAHIHPADAELLRDPGKGLNPDQANQLAALIGDETLAEPEEVADLSDGQELEVAGLRFIVAHAPGHTPGSVVFAHTPGGGEPSILFTGDLLFAGSIGRTDFPGGDHAVILDSLKRVCLSRTDETAVLPGHGPRTTVGRERITNPFLRGIG